MSGPSSDSVMPSVPQSPLQPLTIASHLAPTPAGRPRFAATVQLNSGEALAVADPRATRAMVALMDMNALHGGAASHFGGPAAFAELMSAAHGLMYYWSLKTKRPWHQAFHFVNDAGHCENGLYAIKANYGFADLNLDALKKFRSIDSFLTGHGEAHLFRQGVLVSNGPLGSGISQAQGLAIADAMLGGSKSGGQSGGQSGAQSTDKRVTICALSDGGAMEGEARESMAAIAGLAKRGKLAPFILLVSDNRTKLSGRIETDAFSMEPTFQALEALGWRVIHLADGNHLQACVSTLEEALNQVRQDPTQPVVIHARTVKGKGNKKAEISSSGAHGFPLKKADELKAFLTEIYDSAAVPPEFLAWADELVAWELRKASAPKPEVQLAKGAAWLAKTPNEKIQNGVAAALIKCRGRGLPVVSVSADLQGSTGVADFHKAYPESAIDVGVAESNMISTAVGLSLSGYIPIVDTFAQFGVTKGALPIMMASLSQGPVVGIFSHTGFQDAADGASHQALSFYAQVSAIPHVEVYSLSTSSEAEALITEALENFASDRQAGRVPPTRIFFLGRENFPRRLTEASQSYALGRDQVVFDTSAECPNAVTIVAGGSLVPEAIKAADILQKDGIGAIVVHASAVSKPDLETIQTQLKKTAGRLVTVEEHRLTCGMGSILCHNLAMNSISHRIKSLAVGDHFGQSAYSALDLYKKHGLDAASIAKAAHALMSTSTCTCKGNTEGTSSGL